MLYDGKKKGIRRKYLPEQNPMQFILIKVKSMRKNIGALLQRVR